MTGTPVRTQSLASLQKANKVRADRTKIKQQLGTLPRAEAFGMLADILESVPDCCAKMRPFELLMACDRVGRHYTLTWLRKAGVQEGRYLSELTERQRFYLAELLRGSEGRAAA